MSKQRKITPPTHPWLKTQQVETPLPSSFQPKKVTALENKKYAKQNPKKKSDLAGGIVQGMKNLPRNSDGDTLLENILEFAPGVGAVLSLDDVYRSVKNEGITHPNTMIEAAGLIPGFKVAKILGKSINVIQKSSKALNRLQRNRNTTKAVLATAAAGAHSTDSLLDIENLGTDDKYLTGGYIGNGAQTDPSKVLMGDRRMKAQADLAGASGFLPNFLDMAAPIASNIAGNLGAQQQGKFAKMATPTEDVSTPMGGVKPFRTPPANNYGIRPDGTAKGSGYFGEILGADGRKITELSIGIGDETGDFLIPSVTPNLTLEQMDYIKKYSDFGPDQNMNKSIEDSAMDFYYKQRRPNNLNPFANFEEFGKTPVPTMASGGIVNKPVEVEGEERYELPNGEVGEFQGPSHESGGIDVSLPEGTEVYSKRVKGPDGKTMAKRKEMRDNKISKIEKQLSKNPLDALLSKSLARAKQAFEMQDQQDLAVMQQQKSQQKFARGGVVGKNFLNMFTGEPEDELEDDTVSLLEASVAASNVPKEENVVVKPKNTLYDYSTNTSPTKSVDKKKSLLGLTPGDMLGVAGNITKAAQAYRDTLGDASSNIPNINAYENFGRDGLATLKSNQMTMQQLYDLSTQNLRGKVATNTAQARSSARGVNQMRALDLANAQTENQAQSQIDAQYAGQTLQNNQAIAQQQNAIDGTVMRGEAEKRLADQQDLATDNINLQANRQTMVDALLTQSASVMNKSQQRKLMSGLMSARFGNFEVDEFGNVTGVAEGSLKSTEEQMSDRGLLETYNEAIAAGEKIEFRNGNLYYKDNNELYKAGDKTVQEKEDSLRDYSELLERGTGLGLSEGVNYKHGNITQGKGYKGSATVAKLEPYLKSYSRLLNGADVDLSTKEGVEAMQKNLGVKPDGVIGDETMKALEKYFPDATKESKGYNADMTKKEFTELETLFKSTDPTMDSAIGRAKELYGEFSDEDFAKDKGLQKDISESIFYGAVDYADSLYKTLSEEGKLGGFTKEELRKISLISPDTIKFDEEGNLDIDLDSRVPGTSHTLGYKVRGTKYTKRFAKRD